MLQAVETQFKSPEAFRTISEVALELDVPQHVLRFWESRFAQVKPVKRAGGRRYYRPEDVDLLRGIRTLLYSDGFTIKGVQKILRDRGLRHVSDIGRTEAMLEGAPGEAEETETEELAAEKVFVPHLCPVPQDVMEFALAGEERARLEILLGELEHLKLRLRDARPK